MKIADVRTPVVHAEMRNWGLRQRAVTGAVEDFKPMLIGEDPTRIEHLRQKLYRQSFWRLGVIGMSAISGVPDYKLRHPFQQETIHATTLRAAAGAVLDC